MRRRDFLKGIFGAAALAAVPTIVLKQIDAISQEPEYVPKHLIEDDIVGTTIKRPIPENGLFYIWDKDREELVGACTDFSLNMNANFIDVTSIDDDYRKYMRGVPSWNIEANNVQWLVDPEELFKREPKALLCLMAKDDMKFSGDIYLTQISLTIPFFREEEYVNYAYFEGSGMLEMIIKNG